MRATGWVETPVRSMVEVLRVSILPLAVTKEAMEEPALLTSVAVMVAAKSTIAVATGLGIGCQLEGYINMFLD